MSIMSSEKRKTEDGSAGAPTSKRGRWDSDGATAAPAAAANGTNGTALDPQSTRAKIEAAKAKLAKAKEMLANRQKSAAVRLELCQHLCHGIPWQVPQPRAKQTPLHACRTVIKLPDKVEQQEVLAAQPRSALSALGGVELLT